MILAQLSLSRGMWNVWKHLFMEKNVTFFLLVPFAFLFSLVIFSPLDRLIDNPRRRREHFSRLLHHRYMLEDSLVPSFSRANSKPQGSPRDVVLRGEDPRPATENTRYHAIKTRFSVAEKMVRSSVSVMLPGRATLHRRGRKQALWVLLQRSRFST